MFASAMMFGAMAFAAKIAAARLSGPEVAMVRMAFGLLPVLLVPRWLRSALHVQRVDLILYRGIFGGIAVMLYFMALQHSSVGVATLLNYTSPVWSGLMSMLFLRERFSARVLIPLPIALIGIFLVVHAHASPGEVLGFGRWELAGALSAVAGGAAITAIRAARRTESSWAVYTSFCFFGMIVNAPLAAEARTATSPCIRCMVRYMVPTPTKPTTKSPVTTKSLWIIFTLRKNCMVYLLYSGLGGTRWA